MKKQLLLSGLCIVLSGCDNVTPSVSFAPEMASFSNEFDFDPLRGPVKTFTQTLISEEGKVEKRISGTLSEEGCFDTLELLDLEHNSVVALILDANYYLDAETLEKKIRLQGNCQLAELPAAGLVWEMNDKEFLTRASGKNIRIEYRYDNEGYPIGKTSTKAETVFAVNLQPSTDPLKKLDYTAQQIFNGKAIGSSKQYCDYDKFANPVSCELVMIDESVKPTVERLYTIKYDIEYY